jgi:signal transduction histidine kinase
MEWVGVHARKPVFSNEPEWLTMSDDATGAERDEAAERRDLSAEQRDRVASQRDRSADERDERAPVTSAATSRLSARDRDEAAKDRGASRHDREESTSDREAASADRDQARLVTVDHDRSRTRERLHDRELIAVDLHGTVIHQLHQVLLMLDSAQSLSRDPAVTERIAAAVELLDSAAADLRHVVFGLSNDGEPRPPGTVDPPR